MACADCGCVVERGVRNSTCADPQCCCAWLPTRASLEQMAGSIEAAFASGDPSAFGPLLAEDARWGDEAPNRCRSRSEVVDTFARLKESGVRAAVTESSIGPAGVLCRLRVDWPDETAGEADTERFHLYRVDSGQITDIVPFSDRAEAEAFLSGT